MKHLGLIAGVMVVLLGVGHAQGTVTLKLANNLLGDDETVTVDPGFSFTAYLKLLTSTESTVGVQTTLTQSSGPLDDLLFITGYDGSLSPFTDQSPTSSAVITNGRLDPSTETSLGGLVPNLSSPQGPGSYTIAVLTITVEPLALPGIYTIGPDPSFAEVTSDAMEPLTPVIRSLVVTVTPEPAGLAMLGLAGLLLMRRR